MAKNILSLEELVAIIREAKDKFGIEGVTYSGGEPTLQQNLSAFTEKIQELELGVISFTGRQYEDVKEVLGNCDMVLDGCFDETQPEKQRKLLGSANQRIVELTERYASVRDWFVQQTKTVEVNVSSKVIFNGDHI